MYPFIKTAFLLFFTPALYAQFYIEDRLLNTGFRTSDTTRHIDVILIHSSYCPNNVDTFNLRCVLDLYRQYGVSAHYVIDRTGKIIRLVREKDISYHGGKGTLPDGDNRINSRSIGIELINSIHNGPNSSQYASLRALLFNIKMKYPIKYILGHSDVAPTRKSDPWKFDWSQIADLR